MRKLLALSILTLAVASSHITVKADDFLLESQNFFENKVKVLIPTSFFNASDELVQQRYTDEANRPQIVLTDDDEKILISMSLVPNQGDRKTVIHLYRAIKNSIRESYPNHKFFKTDVVRNRTLAVIEVLLPNQDGEMIYNMMAFKYVGDQFFSFNMAIEQDDVEKWRSTAREIAENIKQI